MIRGRRGRRWPLPSATTSHQWQPSRNKEAAMPHSGRISWRSNAVLVTTIGLSGVLLARAAGPAQGRAGGAGQGAQRPVVTNAMANPYQMVPNWPQLGTIKPG